MIGMAISNLIEEIIKYGAQFAGCAHAGPRVTCLTTKQSSARLGSNTVCKGSNSN